jgi:magnesium transporter
MLHSISHKGVTWYDDPDPQEKMLQVLQKDHDFHELDIEDCLSEHERPKVEDYEDYLFLVFHIPYLSKKSGRILKEEVNIFLGPDYIITLHRGKIPSLEVLRKDLDKNESTRQEFLEHGTGYFLYEVMDILFHEGFTLLDEITKDLRVMETKLFESEEEVDILRDILTLRRNIITMRSILLPQRSLIALLEHKNKKFIPEDLELYFDDILDAIERQWSILDTAKEMSEALQDTHESSLSHKTNAVIRVLTIFSVTMLPLTFLTGLYGMNIGLPLQQNPSAFFFLACGMVVILSGCLGYFYYKKWF